MWRLRGKEGRALGLTAAVVVGAGLAVLVPAVTAPMAHAQTGGASAEPGMIVVSDPVNIRFQVFYPDGTFAFKFGYGSNSIDVGPNGMIVAVGASHVASAYHPDGTFAFAFGSGEGGVGGISNAPKVAVAPDGRIVVVDGPFGDDRVYHRVQVFSPNYGEFMSVFDAGSGGDYLRDVDVGPDGLVVVADPNGFTGAGAVVNGSWKWSDSGHIRAFHLNGTPAFSFPVVGGNQSVLPYPTHVAVGPDGEIVVVEGSGLQVLRVYRPNGTLPNGTAAFALALDIEHDSYRHGTVTDVAVSPDGRIVVGGHSYVVSVYHPNGSLALEFGGYGRVPRGFDSPTDAAVGPDGRIVVAEPGKRTISVFHPNGTLAFSFGGYGHGDGAFYEPHHVAVGPDGRIVVGDLGKHRILVFEPDGTPALAFGSGGRFQGQISGIRDVAVGPNGSVVVSDGGGFEGGRVQVFSPDGAPVIELVSGHHWRDAMVAVGPDGRIVVASQHGAFSVFEPNGTEAFTIHVGPGLVGDVAVGPDGRIVVVVGSHSRVFNPNGEFVFATEIDVHAVSVSVGPSREIAVVDANADRVQVFNPDGTFAFSLLPDLSEGKFAGMGAIAVGPVMPPPSGDPEPLWTSIEPAEVEGEGVDRPILRNFTNVGDVANVTIDVAALAGPGGADVLNGSEASTVTFPASETVVAASFAEVTFPPNVTASHVPEGGLLGLRVATVVPTAEQVQAALGRSADGSGPELIVLLQSVVEVGAEGPRIMFDLPIRIALEGQAGGRAFYIEGPNGTIVPIDEACAADDVDAVHEQLGGAGECQIDSADGGTAKIVHTYHLTKFGTVSAEGPVPVRTDVVVEPTDPPIFFPGGGGGGQPAPGPQPPVVAVPGPPADTCAIGIDSSALDMSARPGEYSEPVQQGVRNAGSRPLERVEIVATPWHDGSGPPTPPPLPGVPPPYSGPTQGRTAGAFTAYMIASLPASVTEVRDDGYRILGGTFFAGGGGASYEPLADDGGTAVLEGLESGAWAPLSFRLNLTAYDGLLAGALVQSVTYQAECVPPAPPS